MNAKETTPEFYMPKSNTIPTELIVTEGNLMAYYRRLPDRFAYEFKVYRFQEIGQVPEEEQETFVKRLADIMCRQSYDYGQSWRIVSIERKEETKYDLPGWIVSFRIRDSW